MQRWAHLAALGMVLRTALGTALGTMLIALPARADQTLTFDGPVPADGPDHFFLPFDVPAGTQEIEIKHDDLSKDNVLDFGLDDPNGYRGWGGGTSEDAVVGTLAASRAYLPGPIPSGKWRVVIGKASVVSSPAQYHVEVTLRDAPTLAAQTGRTPYKPAAPLKRERRWWAGDLHVHSLESTDAKPTLAEIAAFARSRGLDWVEISDHNTITQLDFFDAEQRNQKDLLFVPGIELTTYAGHANAIGATRWIDHRIGQPGVTIDSAADAIAAQGALLSINHPVLDVGTLCLGCAWKHALAPNRVNAVEIATGGLKQGGVLFTDRAIKFWDDLCAKGVHAAAVGGSDDHRSGKPETSTQSPIGDPTTMVLADELSASAIVDAIRKGRTVVKLQGPDDPMVELTSGDAVAGDAIAVRSARLKATVTKGSGAQVRLVKNGAPEREVAVTDDPFTVELVVDAPREGEDRWRAEVLIDDRTRTVTSHLWVRFDPNGPAAKVPEDSGCAQATNASDPGGVWAVSIGAAMLVALRRRRRRSFRAELR
jgi:hypothetical protein